MSPTPKIVCIVGSMALFSIMGGLLGNYFLPSGSTKTRKVAKPVQPSNGPPKPLVTDLPAGQSVCVAVTGIRVKVDSNTEKYYLVKTVEAVPLHSDYPCPARLDRNADKTFSLIFSKKTKSDWQSMPVGSQESLVPIQHVEYRE